MVVIALLAEVKLVFLAGDAVYRVLKAALDLMAQEYDALSVAAAEVANFGFLAVAALALCTKTRPAEDPEEMPVCLWRQNDLWPS